MQSYVILLLAGVTSSALAQTMAGVSAVRARLTLASYQVPVGQPVWAYFAIENTADDPVTLTVPGAQPDIPSPQMGLPIAHVFSGAPGSGVTVTTDAGRKWEAPAGYQKPDDAPLLMIAPHSTVGTRIDLREFFRAMRTPGTYRIAWHPYAGALAADTVVVQIAPLKQADIVTDHGTMTVRLFYGEAPRAVANFLELARGGFYNGLTFHRLEPGHLILGGCPRGDGTGIRADGKRIPLEPNGHPHQKGSVSMALLDDDPDSASCQFFICNTREKSWDGRYTVFGQLAGDESFATLDALMATPVNDDGVPNRPLYIRSIRIVNAPPSYDE